MSSVLSFLKRNGKVIAISALLVYHLVLSGLFIHTFKLLPYEFRWLTDIAILVFFVCSLVLRYSPRNAERFYIIPKVYYLIGIFFIWCFTTTAVNSVSFFTALLQFKDYARFIILALAVINLGLTHDDIKLLMFVILGIILLQIPVTAIQCSIWRLGDWVVGTLSRGGTTDMVFLCSLGVSFIIGSYMFVKKKVALLGIVPFFSLPILFGLNYAGLVLYPFSILYTMLHDLKQNIKGLVLVIGMICAFFVILYAIPAFRHTANRYVTVFDTAFRNQFVESSDSLGRIKAPFVTYKHLTDKKLGWLFGYGFGTTKKSYWYSIAGPYAVRYPYKRNQISTTLLETGFPGLTLFISVLIALFAWGNKMVKQLLNFSKSLALTFTCAVSLMIIGSIYFNILKSYYFGFLLWLIFAFVYTLNSNIVNTRQEQSC